MKLKHCHFPEPSEHLYETYFEFFFRCLYTSILLGSVWEIYFVSSIVPFFYFFTSLIIFRCCGSTHLTIITPPSLFKLALFRWNHQYSAHSEILGASEIFFWESIFPDLCLEIPNYKIFVHLYMELITSGSLISVCCNSP